MAKDRADKLVFERGLAPSREKARALILAGQVSYGSRRIEKAGELVPVEAELSLAAGLKYVSRGGLKLEHALDRFGVDPAGRRCLDVGSSTGGFTDCLLQRGAASVVAVDVGEGQLDWGLRNDARVMVLEGVNARELEPAQVGVPASLVVGDVAFISLTKVLPALRACAPDAEMVLLVKPQFEAGRGLVGRGGVVRDPATWSEVLVKVATALTEQGCSVLGATASPIAGPAGNREFFLHARPAAAPSYEPAALDAAILECQTPSQRAGK